MTPSVGPYARDNGNFVRPAPINNFFQPMQPQMIELPGIMPFRV